ncbi:hypothetical protein GPECTOR_31g289 [Gonium pectorale]|uniref:Uncharacterized protein n=1 Tax=Gonium pectorale TaxID=33097 RepID=A0A150GDK3_GONPE|nr:hypothetical protein GPECTOR_31g289 [Gonium pectorale]|eukprot:KXZ47927.1 hypothetical protein GPECTOR_31g289 [Gonium pectorale]
MQKSKVNASRIIRVDATYFGSFLSGALRYKSSTSVDVARQGRSYSFPSALTKGDYMLYTTFNQASLEPKAVGSGLGKCEDYAAGESPPVEFGGYIRKRIFGFSIRFILIVELYVELNAQIALYSVLTECDLYGRQAFGAGGGITGSLSGVAGISLDIFIAEIGIESGITLAQPTVSTFAAWTPQVAVFGNTQRPACYSTQTNMRGMFFFIKIIWRVLFWGGEYPIFSTAGREFFRKGTGLRCDYDGITVAERLAEEAYAEEQPSLPPSSQPQSNKAAKLAARTQQQQQQQSDLQSICQQFIWLNGYQSLAPRDNRAYLTADVRSRLAASGQPYSNTAFQLSNTGMIGPPLPGLTADTADAFWSALQSTSFDQYLDLRTDDSLTVTVTSQDSDGARTLGQSVGARTSYDTHASYTGIVQPAGPVTGAVELCCYQQVHFTLNTTHGASNSSSRYGFFISFTVEPLSSPPPSPSPTPPSPSPFAPPPPPRPPTPPSCHPLLLMHDDAYMRQSGGYVTSDLRRRLWLSGIDTFDAKDPFWTLPDLPGGDPAGWIVPYDNNLECSWEFRLPQDSQARLLVRCV